MYKYFHKQNSTRYRNLFLHLSFIGLFFFSGLAQAVSYRQVAGTTHFQVPGEVHSITPLSGNIMLLASEGTGVMLADFGQPDNPRIISTARFSTKAEAIAVSRSSQRIYVANGAGGLDILALSSNGELKLLSRLDTPSFAFDVAISPDSKVAYIADNTNGVVVVDVSRSAQPKIITTIPTQASAASVLLSRNGQTLYIAEQARGIRIVNVRTPFSPQSVANIRTRGHAQGMALSNDGKRLFSANNTGGLQIFDISQPRFPRMIGQAGTQNAFAVTLSADNHTAFVSDLFNGVQTIDVSQPHRPVKLDNIKIHGTAEDVALLPGQKTALVAGGRSGISIISFR